MERSGKIFKKLQEEANGGFRATWKKIWRIILGRSEYSARE
jgi:hypothetical protein